jgi:hypothetical protein
MNQLQAKPYKVYSTPVCYKIFSRGRVIAEPTDIVEWARAAGRAMTFPSHNASVRVRPELRFEPHIEGLTGPVFEGSRGDTAIISYTILK